jgi:hypothetical protein
VFRSIVDLQGAIKRSIEDHNAEPNPFVWTADPDAILENPTRGIRALASLTIDPAVHLQPETTAQKSTVGRY